MITKTRIAARKVINQTGRGHMIFNDRLVDGARSLKVWGWSKEEYRTAAALLRAQGCEVITVSIPKKPYRGEATRIQTRLHVYE